MKAMVAAAFAQSRKVSVEQVSFSTLIPYYVKPVESAVLHAILKDVQHVKRSMRSKTRYASFLRLRRRIQMSARQAKCAISVCTGLG